MQPKVIPANNAVERDRLVNLFTSVPFKAFEARVTNELERARLACENVACPMAEVRAAQGAAMALRCVLSIPAIMLREMDPPPAKK